MKQLKKEYLFLIPLFFILLCCLSNIGAQGLTSEQKGILNKGVKSLKKDNYTDALTNLQQLTVCCSDNLDVNRYLGECLFMLSRGNEAIPYYEHAQSIIRNKEGSGQSDEGVKSRYYRDLLRYFDSRIAQCKIMAAEQKEHSKVPENNIRQMSTQSITEKSTLQNADKDENVTKFKQRQSSNGSLMIISQDGIFQDNTQHLKFRLYPGNPTSLTRYNLENQDDSWKIPSEAELKIFLKNIIDIGLKDDPAISTFLSPDSAPFLSTDFEYDQGDKQFHCFYIEGNEIKMVNKESIDEVNILLNQ